jgi:hypothetical protein
MPENEVRKVLEIIAEKVCIPPLWIKEANEKAVSVLKRAERKARNLSDEVHDFELITTDHFTITESHNRLQVITKQGKNAISRGKG